MSKNRYFALILSILMLLQMVVPLPAEAVANTQNSVTQTAQGQMNGRRSEIFEFKNNEKPKFSWFTARRQSLFGARDVGLTKSEKVKIETEATGLDDGDKEFNWEAFGQNKKFEAWIEVAYVGEKDDQGLPIRQKVSDVFDINAAGTIETNIIVDASKTVENYYIVTEYDKEPDSFKINAFFDRPTVTSDKAQKSLTFKLGVHQIVSTKITYNLIDEYGKEIDLNDVKAEKPADTDLKGLGKIGKDITFDLKNEGTNNLWQEQELDEWDLMDSSLALSLTKDQVTSGGIDYKLTSTYDVINGGTVTIKRQKDVVTPKDQHNPGNVPDGYARINLVADETGSGSRGTFATGDATDNTRVVDVKAGKPYTLAKAEIDKQGKPFPLTEENKEDKGKTFKAWAPELSTLGTAVDKATKTLNATYQASKVEIIPYLPTEPVPTHDKDNLPIPTNYVTVTFKSEDATKGNVKIGDKEGATVLAKVKPGIDLSQKTEITTKPAEHYGFTKWEPALAKAADGQVYTARFVKSGEEIGKNDPIPEGWYRVTVSQDADSIQAGTVPTKYYPVEPNGKLAADKFADLTNAAKEGYKDPAWYVGSDKVDKPYEVVINSSMDFIARATELESHKITKNNGLKPVDIKAYKGDTMGEGFWKKGVALTTPDENLQKLLDAAKVADATSPARTTEKAGEQVGTLKVTFKDGSTIDVQNQKLTVKETEVKINFDKDANDDANAPRAKEEVVKGKISAADESTVIDGATIVIKDKEDKVIGRGLANDDGSFVVGTKRPLVAGETLKIAVTLPGVEKASTPVDKQVKLNPDDLNKVLPVGDKLYENLKGKPGVSKAKLNKLKEAVDAGYKLVPKAADQMAQKPATSVALSDEGQKSLDNAAKAINDAIKALTDNTAPVVTGTAFKEIFKGDTLNLEAGIEVKDADSTQDESDIAQQDGKDFSYKVYTTNDTGEKVEVKGDALTNLNQTPGSYEVVYMAKDKSGAEGTFTMTLVVKDIVYTKIAVTTDPTKTEYLVKDKGTKATPDYTGTVVTLTKNNGDTETATYDKESGKFKIGEKAIDGLTIAPKEVAVAESPAVITATYKAGKTELTAKANKAVIVQIDSDGNGVADTEENFDIAKAKTMEITNQPTLSYELDPKTGKATLDLKPLVVKVTDSLGNFKYFGYEEIKGDAKFALALGTDAFDKAAAKELTTADNGKKVKVTLTYKENKTLDAETSAIKVEDKRPNVIENPTPGETREGYVSVQFNAGANGGLKGVNTFLVKKDTASSEVKVPTIVPAAGYKVKTDNGGWDKAIPAKFTADFTATAQYEEDVATSETPKDGYTPITFDALDKGKIGDARTKIIYVNPAKEVNLSEKAPQVTANTGYSFKAWDPAIDTAKKYTKEERILATYTSDELVSDKEKAGYIKVTFDQGKHGKFNVTDPAQKTDYWVKPGTLVDLRAQAPKLTADAGYIHTGWSQDLVVNFKADAGDQTITAQYGLDSDYSTTEKASYTKITFDKGANGDFAKGAKTELWVNPAKELTLPAPGIVPHPGYSHTGWTKDNAAVNLSEKAKYTKATTITAAYESDISETEKTGYVKVSFDADKNGTIAENAKKDFWVNPNKEVNLTDKAPAVTPNSGYLFIKWDHKLVDTFNKATTIKATYASAGDIKTEETDGFTKVTFDAGQNGKFAEGAQVTYWVNPDKELVLPEPRVIPNKGFEHTGWDPALTPAKKYAQETTIKATYKQEISTTKVDGHQEIKFLAGDDGTFADGKKEISIWVKPDTLVDLRKSAPEVTVTTEGKTFTGWDKDLVGSFAKSDQATVFNAQYAGSTSETPVPGWTEITFKAGEHGNFGTLNKTPIVEKKLWVDPKADVKLSDKAPKTIDDKNWSFDKWMDGENAATGLDVLGKYTEAKTYTASYKSDISTTPQEGFVKVTFAPGTDGSFEQGAVTETYVRANKEVDIADKAPKATPNAGLSFTGWAIGSDSVDLTKIKVSNDTTITAQYTKAISDKQVDGWTRLQFKSGENGRFVQDAITVKWVDPKVKLTLKAIAPGITPDTNYRLSAWNDGSANVDLDAEKLFEAPATFTAQYEKIASDTKIEGFTKITFKSGEHGNFGTKENNPVIEKDIWVNPKSEVKLSEIAPELVIDTNWSFDKWMDGQAAADMNTAQKFTAEKTLTATYESDFSDTAKDGFVKVEFKAGEHGTFEKINDVDQKTIVYVRKDKEVDMTVKEPKVTPENGYYFTGWDKPLQKVYTQDTIHTGKNEKAIATEAVDGWTQITFNAGDKGLFKPDAKTVIWVKPNTKITLDDQVPGLEIEKGYSCIGWKKNAETKVADLTVPATYDKSTTFTAAYESDFSKDNKEGFVEVKFKAGDNGNFGKTTGASSTEVKDYSVWVRPDKEVDLTDQAPEVTAHVGWKANGWDKEITKVTVKADTAEDARTFTAQYVKDSDTSKTEKPGYKKITFKAGDHGTFANDAETVVYVNPDSEIQLSTIAPKVNPAINYSFKTWNNGSEDVALTAKTKYANETTYTAQYESDISDTAKEGFVEVKFDAGTDGEFKQVKGVDQKTTFYVKKDKLVDLTDVAPTVTGKEKKTFTGWDSDLKRTFTDASTTINAKYTESISDKYVEGWTQLDFDQGDHGRFAKGQKNVKWVDPDVDLKLDDIAPKINPDPNWSLKAWNDGAKDVVGTEAQKFTKATTFTATYENAFSPEAKEGFVKVTFDKGEHGKFVKEAVTEIYVKKDVELDLREKAPTVIPNQGWGHKGWTINGQANNLTKVKVTEDTTIIKADYAEGKFDADKITKIMVVGPTQMGYGVGEKLNLDGLKVIAIDDAGLQKTYEYDNGELVDKTKNNDKLGATIKVADKDVTFKEDQGKKVVTTELAMADNGKHIVVTKGQDPNKVTGETVTALKIHENKSAKAENVKALNQNEVGQDGKPTDKAKTTTTVTGKVKPGATVKILDKEGKDITPQNGVKVENDGTFTAEVTKQTEGDKIQVIATEKGKQPAEPADATVERDANNDGKADGDADQKTAAPTAKALNQNKVDPQTNKVTDEPKETTTITGKAEKGAKVVAKATIGNKEVVVGTTTADENTGVYTIEATKDGQPNGGVLDLDTEVKVTAQVAGKLVSDATPAIVARDADNDGKDDKGQDFKIDQVEKLVVVKQPQLKYTAKDAKDGESKFKLNLEGMIVRMTDKAGKEKLAVFSDGKFVDYDDTNKVIAELKADPTHGTMLKPETGTEDTQKGDSGKKIKVTGPNDKFAETEELKVFYDANKDGKPDYTQGQKTPAPSVMARNIGKTPKATTVEGMATPGAVIKITDKDGAALTTTPTEVKADESGHYTATLSPILADGTDIKVTAKLGEMAESDATPAKVFDDVNDNKQPDRDEGFNIKKVTTIEFVNQPALTYFVKTKDAEVKFDGKDANGNTIYLKLSYKNGDKTESKIMSLEDLMKDKDITVTPEKTTTSYAAEYDDNHTAKTEAKLVGKKIVVSLKDKADVKVESDNQFAIEIDADGNKTADRTEMTTITSVMARNIGTGTTTPKAKATFTTIEGVAEKGATVTIKFNNGQDVTKTVKADDQTGAYKLELKGATEAENILLPAETEVSASAQVGEKKASTPPITTKVFEDLDADGKADDPNANKTERPSALASNFKEEAKTTIKGEAEPGAKVVAKVGETEVGEATANSDGKYEISATKDGTKLLKGTKVSVTATLDPKGTSPAQETIVYDDLDGDGQPDTAQAFDKDKIRGLEVVASPNKMVYNNKEQLDLTGMKVKLTDQMGNMKLVEFSKFEEYDITVSPLNKTELSDKNNGQKIKAEVKVAIGNNQETYSGETPTGLVVNKDRSAQPTDIFAANQGDKTTTTVKGKAIPGAKVEVKNAKGDVIGTVNQVPNNGEFQVEVTKQAEKAKIYVTATEEGKTESAPQEATVIRDKDGDWKEDGGKVELEKPVVDTIKVGDETVKVKTPGDGIIKITVKDENGKTIDVVKDGNDWKVDGKAVGKDGNKLVIPTKDKNLNFGPNETVEITNQDAEGNEGKTVVATKPANLLPMEKPTIDPISTESTKITGKALPGSKVTVTLPGSNDPQEASVKSDGSFELILEKPLADKSVVEVTATNSQREGVGKETATVGLNLRELEKTKTEADGLINDSKTGNNFDPDKNTYDKNLENKTKAAQDIIDRAKDNKNDNDPNQTKVNEAEKDLRDAINQKNADDKVKVVEKAVKDGQKPTDEQIKAAQDAIDKVADPTAKQELQARLDLAKKIVEGDDRLKQDDIKDKPKQDVDDLKKAVEDGKKALDPKENKSKTDATKTIEKALNQINMERIIVGVDSLAVGAKTLEIKTSVPRATVVIKIAGVEIGKITTDSFGTFSKGLRDELEEGQTVALEASKTGYNDGSFSDTVY